MRSPGRIFFSQKNTAGPVRESTCPAMTADPVAPGRGLPVYQPTTVVALGTWSVPFRLRPSLMIGVLTPMAGMVSQTGLGVGWTTDGETGPTGRPAGAGRAASRTAGADVVRATTRPAVPAPAASSPALSIAADSSRACAPHAAETQPALRGRRATARGAADGSSASGDGGARSADADARSADADADARSADADADARSPGADAEPADA